MPHKKKFVTSGEIWTFYLLMIVAAFFWGGMWSYLAFRGLHFNRDALLFLAMLTVTTGLTTGASVYAMARYLIFRAADRAADTGLDIP